MRTRLALPCLLLAVGGVVCVAENLPETHSKALDGTAVAFPGRGGGKPLLVMVGFSHQSSGQFESWNKEIFGAFWGSKAVDCYAIVELQGVPRFVNPLILHGMRREIKPAEQSHFVPIYTDETEWKRAVGFSAADDAYVLVADASGRVVWRTHGPPDAGKIAGLKTTLARLERR
jgi:hypothetical protein